MGIRKILALFKEVSVEILVDSISLWQALMMGKYGYALGIVVTKVQVCVPLLSEARHPPEALTWEQRHAPYALFVCNNPILFQ